MLTPSFSSRSFSCLALMVLLLTGFRPFSYALEVTFNGEPIAVRFESMNGTVLPKSGDICTGAPFDKFVLADTQPHHLVADDDEPYIWRKMADGSKQLLQIEVPDKYELDSSSAALKSTLTDPFVGLSEAQLEQLSAVYLNRVPPSFSDVWAKINWEHCLLVIRINDLEAEKSLLQNLPPTLRYLELQSRHGKLEVPHPLALTYLQMGLWPSIETKTVQIAFNDNLAASTTTLKYLSLATESALSDPTFLNQFVNLKTLILHAPLDAKSYAFIPKCSQLRILGLSESAFTDTSLLSGLSELRELSLSSTQVSDLRPLKGMDSLTKLDVTRCPIEYLPKSTFPSLREIWAVQLYHSSLEETDYAQFRRTNPHCRILFTYDETLRQSIAGTDRIRVWNSGVVNGNATRVLFELKDSEEVETFLKHLHVIDPQSNLVEVCMCLGNPTLEFYRGETLLETVTCHHGLTLRWRFFPGNLDLTPESSLYLLELMKAKGCAEIAR